ncbi:ketoacyl-ACP synthase III [bacterium]|nr:ketoacyl-ACP synthase III [bacterium]
MPERGRPTQAGISVQDICYALPEHVVTGQALSAESPGWDMEVVEARAGVLQRHVAGADETALDLAVRACRGLFARHPEARERMGGILFCTETPDHILPPNACILHKALELPNHVAALDFNLGCSGFPYGLMLAQGLILARVATDVLLVTGDTAAATWIAASERQGLLDILCATDGARYDKFIIPAGGCRLPRSAEAALPEGDRSGNARGPDHIHMDGLGILNFVSVRIPQQIRELLKRSGLAVDDISLFVFHQASKVILESLARLLGLPQEKVYCNLQRAGNTVSASIPMALRDAWDEGRLARASCFQASASASRGPAHGWSSREGAACSRHSYNSS